MRHWSADGKKIFVLHATIPRVLNDEDFVWSEGGSNDVSCKDGVDGRTAPKT